jgi:hypothetical protein
MVGVQFLSIMGYVLAINLNRRAYLMASMTVS